MHLRHDFFDCLHVTPYLHEQAGGPPVVVRRVIEAATGNKTYGILSTDAMVPQAERPSFAQVVGTAEVHIVRGARAGQYAFHSSAARIVDPLVRRSRIVIVHGCWHWPGLVAMRIARRLNRPYLVMPHGMLDPHSVARGWLKKRIYGGAIEWPLIRDARALICTHRSEGELAARVVSGLPPYRIVSLGTDLPPPVGREVLAGEFFAAHPHIPPAPLTLLFLGRLHPKKGLELLMRGVAAMGGGMWRLVVAGAGEREYEQALRSLGAQLGIGDRISWLGHISGRDKWRALSAADLFVLPSYQENFGLAITESLACGTPVIVSRRVNIWDDLMRAGVGWACDPSEESVRGALEVAMSDADGRRRAGIAGRELVARQYSWENTARQLTQVIDEVCS